MKERTVTFETAKLAKEKNFNVLTDLGFSPDGEELDTVWKFLSNDNRSISRPTQSLLQTWLREVHNIAVIPCFNDNVAEEYYYFIHTNTIKAYSNRICSLPNKFNNYEDALEIGLQEALKLIKDERQN